MCRLFFCFFFFKQKTAYEMRISDWSSDVCSSDLTMKLQLPSDWRLDLSGTIGRSQTNIASQNYVTGAIASTTGGFYDNRIRAIELRGDGSLLALPGGNLGLAVGGGYRAFRLSAKSIISAAGATTNLLNIDHQENVAFAYGELSLPIFGQENRTAFADFLQLSAAVRYERYEGLADVARSEEHTSELQSLMRISYAVFCLKKKTNK